MSCVSQRHIVHKNILSFLVALLSIVFICVFFVVILFVFFLFKRGEEVREGTRQVVVVCQSTLLDVKSYSNNKHKQVGFRLLFKLIEVLLHFLNSLQYSLYNTLDKDYALGLFFFNFESLY